MAGSSLIKKLGLKPGQRALLMNAPDGYRDLLGALPEGVELHDQPEGSYDFIQLFIRNKAQLEHDAPVAIAALKQDGMFWISYPKQSSKVPTDITRDRGWDVVEQAGLQGVAMVSVDDVWSAMRFRPKR